MSTAPKVEYFTDSYDKSTDSEGKEVKTTNGKIETIALWDAGIVDSGETSETINIYVFNNNAGTEDVSDMQNVKLGVVSNETGHQGAKTDDVWNYAWCHVAMNQTVVGASKAENFVANEIALGWDQDKKTAAEKAGTGFTSDQENFLEMIASGLDSTKDDEANRIKGTSNDGTLTNSAKNFCKVTAWIALNDNAAAGQHKFRLRTTYSYT